MTCYLRCAGRKNAYSGYYNLEGLGSGGARRTAGKKERNVVKEE